MRVLDNADPLRLERAAVELRRLARLGLREPSASRRASAAGGSAVLWSLPPVLAAGTSSTARFEYLVQAVVDALDALDPTVTAGEIRALRVLFGLRDGGRQRAWLARQEAAAAELGVSYDHFRRRIQGSLLQLVAGTLLDAAEQPGRSPGPTLVAVARQAELEVSFVDHVRTSRPPEALLLELSTATIGPLLDALDEAGTAVRLLVADPYRATASWQQERMWLTIVDRLRTGPERLDVRVYSVPPGLRGRLVGDLVATGWYTHRDNRRLDADDPAAAEVWGHDNAMVAGRVDQADGRVLATWFRREFDRLWHHRRTIAGDDVRRLLGLGELPG